MKVENYCSYKELFEMWFVARLRRIMFRNDGFSNFIVVTNSCLKCGLWQGAESKVSK
jgi:hypothetical protein